MLIAFLNPGQAQEVGAMPAELEISLDGASTQGPGFHLSGTIPLQLPDGDDAFTANAKMRANWRLTPAYRKCRLNVAFVAVQLAGRRIQDRLRLALSLTPDVLQPACGDERLSEAASRVIAETGDLNSTEFTLLVAEGSNEERTMDASSHLGKLTGKLTLHLACPVGLALSEGPPLISVLPAETVQWPLLFDDARSSEELRALAAKPSTVGLTRPGKPYPPRTFFRAASTRATLGQGSCFWVESVQVDFPPVEMLLSSKYPAGTCEYNVIREHEMLHYQDLQILFRRYQDFVITAVREASLPTIDRPIFVGSVMEGTRQSKTRLQDTLQPIYASMEKARQADADARDGPEQRVLSWSQCPSWYARLTGLWSAGSVPPEPERTRK
jgi:hypothetical protein